MRKRLSFNQGWKFVREYVEEAIAVDYELEKLERWESVNLPHSLRLEPFEKAGVFTYQGIGMYRKHFVLEQKWVDKKLFIEFEAVMGVTDVWVNGVHLQTALANETPDEAGAEAHTNYGGYLPFVVALEGIVKFDGTENVIVVLTDNRDNGQVPPGKPQALLDFT
ncbi:MAG: sugar-binding domain-containing protein, partial [Cellulosilyticaceae bacterium]